MDRRLELVPCDLVPPEDSLDVSREPPVHRVPGAPKDEGRARSVLRDRVEEALSAQERELDLRLSRQRPERPPLAGCQFPRGSVQDAERPKTVARVGDQGNARVKPDARLSRDERVVDEARIGERVGHHQRKLGLDGAAAERVLARRLRDVEPHPRLEPLSILVDQAHQSHRRLRD